MVVYIAGAIDLIDRASAEGWRKDVKALLEERGVDYIDPLFEPARGHSPNDVFLRNSLAFQQADAVFAEHAFHVPHYGTTVEIEEAVRRRKPTVVWVGRLAPPTYLLRHKGGRFKVAHTIPEAVDALLEMAATITRAEEEADAVGRR